MVSIKFDLTMMILLFSANSVCSCSCTLFSLINSWKLLVQNIYILYISQLTLQYCRFLFKSKVLLSVLKSWEVHLTNSRIFWPHYKNWVLVILYSCNLMQNDWIAELSTWQCVKNKKFTVFMYNTNIIFNKDINFNVR